MADADMVAAEPADLVIGEMDAMGEPDAIVEPAAFLEIVDRPAAELVEAVLVLVAGLAEMGVQPAIEALGEADRIVTLLTRDHGLVRAVAKGVRRTRSKFGARLEPFAHIDVQLHPGRNLDIVSDYGRYTCACAVLETAERLAGEERAPVRRSAVSSTAQAQV